MGGCRDAPPPQQYNPPTQQAYGGNQNYQQPPPAQSYQMQPVGAGNDMGAFFAEVRFGASRGPADDC